MSKARRRWASQEVQSEKENFDNVFSSQSRPSTSSQASRLTQCGNELIISRTSQQSSQNRSSLNTSQNIQNQEKMQMISRVIKYLLMAGRNKQPVLKSNIIKNILNSNKEYSYIMKEVKTQLSEVFGYKLVVIEGNKYIIVNEISNNLPHLNFKKTTSSQILLFLVLVHIFMIGEPCKEEVLWNFLQHLDIVTNDNYVHEYFGDVKQLITVDFVNQKYLEKIVPDKDDPTKFEYKWGCRALNEVTYRSALEFVAKIYNSPLKKWNLQFKIVKQQETEQQSTEIE